MAGSTDAIWITEVVDPPSGIRLAVKDLFDTAGLRTTYGSAIFADHVPAGTAQTVKLLAAAGHGDGGQGEPPRVPPRAHPPKPPHRGAPEPPPPRPAGGRLERRLGRGPCGGPRGRRARLRLGRVDPNPRRLLRRRRFQADLRARPDRRLLPARAELRPRRADGPRRRRLRPDDGGARPGVRGSGGRARRPARRRRLAGRGGSARP